MQKYVFFVLFWQKKVKLERKTEMLAEMRCLMKWINLEMAQKIIVLLNFSRKKILQYNLDEYILLLLDTCSSKIFIFPKGFFTTK